MRYLLIAAAFLLLPAVVPPEVEAAGPGQGIQIVNNNYIINDNCNHNDNRNVRGRVQHGRSSNYGYRSSRNYGYHRRSFETHNEAVARIQATHSRHRTTYHPRSMYNGAPYYPPWQR